jgi:serine/threonine protein kinase
MPLANGSRLRPYEISGPIGVGGMGEVYWASDPKLGREVAIKVLPAALADDPDGLRPFEQEARATAALSHRNILVVFDVGGRTAPPYLVSELLEGDTLRVRLFAWIPTGLISSSYDARGDGIMFAIINADQGKADAITVVLNWGAELKR